MEAGPQVKQVTTEDHRLAAVLMLFGAALETGGGGPLVWIEETTAQELRQNPDHPRKTTHIAIKLSAVPHAQAIAEAFAQRGQDRTWEAFLRDEIAPKVAPGVLAQLKQLHANVVAQGCGEAFAHHDRLAQLRKSMPAHVKITRIRGDGVHSVLWGENASAETKAEYLEKIL